MFCAVNIDFKMLLDVHKIEIFSYYKLTNKAIFFLFLFTVCTWAYSQQASMFAIICRYICKQLYIWFTIQRTKKEKKTVWHLWPDIHDCVKITASLKHWNHNYYFYSIKQFVSSVENSMSYFLRIAICISYT